MARALTRSLLLAQISLLGLAATGAQGQAPGSRSRTSAVGTLFPDSSAAPPATPAPPPAPGALRQLVCRGNAGTHVVVEQKPSPRSSAQVAVVLAYRRNPAPAGGAFERLDPGACSWTQFADASIPQEPGVVHFDLDLVGSEFIADPESMQAWMADPAHYWSFYVDDKSNVSISHGAYGAQFRSAPDPRDPPKKSTASSLRREQLRCRGGMGYDFAQAKRLGPNQVAVRLTYPVARTSAGRLGRGLEPGQCAWDDRTDARAEPGWILFITPGNAQLKQQQAGSEVDRSPTAAERWPDAHTIPAYLNDSTHYWTFTVSLANPDSALHHKAWKPAVEAVQSPPPVATAPAGAVPTVEGTAAGDNTPGVGAKPPAGTGTRVTLPGSSVGERYDPGTSTTFDPREGFDIRNVQVRTGLDGASILFDAGPNLAPVVTVATSAPSGSPGSYSFGGQPLRLTVQGTAVDGGHWHYTAASTTPLARGTQYWFIADAPEGPNSRHNQATGEFRTLRQRLTLGISHIDVVSDGDSDSDGELWFAVVSCPHDLEGDIVGDHKTTVDWTEGRHAIGKELESKPGSSVPDRIRIFIVGNEDDGWLLSGYGSSSPYNAWWHCGEGPSGSLAPYSTSKAEWNAAILDLDLSKMAGTATTESFVKRSQPLRDGSKVAFEVRGYYTVTRE